MCGILIPQAACGNDCLRQGLAAARVYGRPPSQLGVPPPRKIPCPPDRQAVLPRHLLSRSAGRPLPTGGPRLPMFHPNETIRYADGKRCDMKLLSWNIQWGRGMDGRVDLARILRT